MKRTYKMKRNIINSDELTYKIVLIMTIDNKEPIYYRLVNLGNYHTEEIPAYRIFDEIVNKGKKIVNARIEHNKLVIVDEDGYDSTKDVIIIDIFDKEVDDIYSWALSNGSRGTEIIQRYDTNNRFSLSNASIGSKEKLAWTCDKGHTIYCGFATYFATNCDCPMCLANDSNGVLSLRYWSRLAKRTDILDRYEEAGMLNKMTSREIAWNSRKLVKFKNGDEIIEAKLDEVTNGDIELKFKGKSKINLTKQGN